MSKRVSFAEAGEAGRAAIARANRAPQSPRHPGGMTGLHYRVLGAVVSLTAMFSKVDERLYVAQVAAYAYDVAVAAHDQVKRTGRALSALHGFGVLHYEPAHGAGQRSFVSLDATRECCGKGASVDPLSTTQKGCVRTPKKGASVDPRKGASVRPEKGASVDPPTEKFPEKNSRGDFRGVARDDDGGSTAATSSLDPLAGLALARQQLSGTTRHTSDELRAAAEDWGRRLGASGRRGRALVALVREEYGEDRPLRRLTLSTARATRRQLEEAA